MNIHHATRETCHNATGIVVVIDVLRAFTTAPYAFDAGVSEIFPVGTVEEAMTLKAEYPGSLVMGEVNGFPPPEFDFGNSPSALIGKNLSGKRLIQRTSAGTQGLVLSANAQTLLAASFVCAAATIRFIQALPPSTVTLVSTDRYGEDQACADYLEALLLDQQPDSAPFLARLEDAGQKRIDRALPRDDITAEQVTEFKADLACAAHLDRFDFALLVERDGAQLIMKKEPC